MAYTNFIPTIWNEAIMRELERLCVFATGCNRKYEGDVKKKGDSVTILGVGKPTISTLARNSRNDDINGPEEIEGTSVIMPINQIRYFNYMIGDIDRAQAVNGVMDSLSQESSEGLASAIDEYIAERVSDPGVSKVYASTPKIVTAETSTTGEAFVLDALDTALQKLYENDVSTNTPVEAIISPRFYKLFKRAYLKNDTDNHELMKNGKVAMYSNITIRMSNNVYKTDSGAVDNIMVRTQRAVAFANPMTHNEAYRPEKKFADALKGFTLFDAKVVRPKEIVNLAVKYA